MTITAGWLLVGALVCLALFLAAIFSLLITETRADDRWEQLARKPYTPPGFHRVDVNIVDRPFDFEQWEQEVDAR